MKLVSQWCHFKYLPMECVDARMKLETWTPCLGAKGMLQQAWFRIHGIPLDQRSVRTIAKVGGLVGKVLEIDETTRFRHDYARTRIARMDVTKVPRTARSTLGLFIHEFVYEREVEVDQNEKILKSGIRVGDKDHQSSPKRNRDEDKSTQGKNTNLGEKFTGKLSRMGNDKDNNHSQSDKMVALAPPKMKSGINRGSKLTSDA